MALPKITQPKFNIEIPSTGKKTTFVPFTVKEEKILLIAKESKDFEQIITSMKQIIQNCVDDVDVDKLAIFDLEYLMLNLRSQSVSNKLDFVIIDPETEEEVNLEINIQDMKVHKSEKHTKLIKLRDDVYIEMAYPKIEMLAPVVDADNDKKSEKLFDMMLGCIDKVIQGEEVYVIKEFTQAEQTEFLDSLTTKDIASIKEFFDTMPALRYETKYKRKDGSTKTFIAEGTETFFI